MSSQASLDVQQLVVPTTAVQDARLLVVSRDLRRIVVQSETFVLLSNNFCCLSAVLQG